MNTNIARYIHTAVGNKGSILPGAGEFVNSVYAYNNITVPIIPMSEDPQERIIHNLRILLLPRLKQNAAATSKMANPHIIAPRNVNVSGDCSTHP